jgi:hypothetical protein
LSEPSEVSVPITNFFRFRRAASIGLAALLVLPLTTAVRLAGQGTASADEHKAWMNDASDGEEDFRAAVTDKDAKGAAAALSKIEQLMQKTEAYWTAKKANDGVALTKETGALASQAAAAAAKGSFADASTAFDNMTAKCNACHELHLEKR